MLENQKFKQEYYLYNKILIFIKDQIFPTDINMEDVILTTEYFIPQIHCNELDDIFIGDFSLLKEIKVNYSNGAIYISNYQQDIHSLKNDFITGIARASEDLNRKYLYNDGRLEKEFIDKRIKLFNIMNGISFTNRRKIDLFMDLDYSEKFIKHLFNIFPDRDKIRDMTSSFLLYPECMFSIKDYYIHNFLYYYFYYKTKDIDKIIEFCPIFCQKIIDIENSERKIIK